ncbi:MAG: TIGR01244 family sulfur transferase [Brevundimonas sp.]|uniref:TIGR01244 family sulfur transferase n=1 Tax=Brevundimonas sp. TaxID=1871086 RepID=UPI002734B3AD|nr:TIGR01244 family sulfur transferase [Brevundimonas sp.]MDP3404247.1 TIGR01244 family sulfur transferase [Brevundimonas sp.]
MSFKPLTPFLSVAPQISEADVALAARQGFRSIIDNRPDGEEPGQPSAAEMKALAEAHGLGFAHVPTVGGQVSDDHVAMMAEALKRLEGPVLAYCRTGTRSTILWALSEAGVQPADALIAAASGAGYDLSALRPRLEAANVR